MKKNPNRCLAQVLFTDNVKKPRSSNLDTPPLARPLDRKN